MDAAPATRPATPAVTTAARLELAAATPTILAALAHPPDRPQSPGRVVGEPLPQLRHDRCGRLPGVVRVRPLARQHPADRPRRDRGGHAADGALVGPPAGRSGAGGVTPPRRL